MKNACWIILIVLLFSSASHVVAASGQAKQYAGIYCLPPGEKPDKPVNLDSNLWQADFLTGWALRSVWSVTEKEQGQYNWSMFDHGLQLAHANNKKVSLSVAAGGFCPDWVINEGATAIDITVQTNFAGQQNLKMVLPWSPVFHKEWSAYVAAMAARYDNDPAVSYVYVGGPGMYMESYVVQNEADYQKFVAAGGLPAWIKGVEDVIDMYGMSFKNTPFVFALGNPVRVPSEHGIGEQAVREVAAYGVSHYPGRFGLTGQGLNPNAATRGARFFVNEMIKENSATSPVGYQMVGATSGFHLWGNAGGLAGSLDAGFALKAHFIEVYQADCENPQNADLLKRANTQLSQGGSQSNLQQ